SFFPPWPTGTSSSPTPPLRATPPNSKVSRPRGGRPPFTELHIRLSKSPAVTISAIRGRARGAGSEFALATDIRFASRERAILGQFEIGIAALPEGGLSTRLPDIVRRGRA